MYILGLSNVRVDRDVSDCKTFRAGRNSKIVIHKCILHVRIRTP